MSRKLPDAEAKRTPLNMRTTAALRAKLDAVCAENGRSLAQEVEFRLERSFAEQSPSDLRTIIREEIEADRKRQGPHPMTVAGVYPTVCPMNSMHCSAYQPPQLASLNGYNQLNGMRDARTDP